MTSKSVIRTCIIIAIILANISCDQISKRLVRDHLGPDQMIGMLDNHLTLTRTENTGAFLSIGQSLPGSSKHLLLSFLPLVALVIALLYVLRRSDMSPYQLLALCLIIGGGIGNIVDRVIHGSVTDFLYIDLGFVHTGVFNVADLSITTGALMILFRPGLLGKPKRNMPAEGDPV